jgi:hypothetical protein
VARKALGVNPAGAAGGADLFGKACGDLSWLISESPP